MSHHTRVATTAIALALLACACTGSPPAGAPPEPAPSGTVAFDHLVIPQNTSVAFGALALTMQADGNLVVYQDTTALWATGTASTCANTCSAVFGDDGNLVVLDGTDAVWTTGLAAANDAQLVLSPRAPYLEIEDRTAISWASSYTFSELTLVQGTSIDFGGLRLTMQADGNLVLYPATGDGSASALWASNTHAACPLGACRASFRDGNLVVYAGSEPLWSALTAGSAGTQLVLSASAPELAMIDANLVVAWSDAVGDAASSQRLFARMKTAACNVDGMLQNTDPDTLAMMARSSCVFLQRAVDPWASVPDLALISANVRALRQTAANPALMIGVFLPEAIPDIDETVVDLAGQSHSFSFGQYCLAGSVGWRGPGTCKPDLTNAGYAGWLLFLEDQLLQLGITVFQFGQVQLMDPGLAASSLYSQMRAAGASSGLPVMISGQTNAIDDPAYLASFDFIVGGSYLNRFGYVQPPPATRSGASTETTGSTLLWSAPIRAAAPAVFIETDWWNVDDDAHRFAELSTADRATVIRSLYDFYAGLGVAFVVPFHIPLVARLTIAATCHGATTDQYSASRTYCGDEDAFNAMLAAGPTPSTSQTLAHDSLTLMPGDSIGSPTSASAVALELTTGGALVATDAAGKPLWTSPGVSCPTAPCTAHLQPDGNTVLRDATGRAYWATNTSGSPGAELMLHAGSSAPYVEVIATDETVLWQAPP